MQKELLKCLILDRQTTTIKEARKKLDMMTQSPSDGWLPKPLKIAYTLRLLMWLDHLSQQVFLWPTWFPTNFSIQWSYGVTVWEIFTCVRVPYAGMHAMSLLSELKSGYRLEKPGNMACNNAMLV